MTIDDLNAELDRIRRNDLPSNPHEKWIVLALETQRHLDTAIQAGESAYARGVEAGRDMQAKDDAKVTCPGCVRGGGTVDMKRRCHISEVDGLPTTPCCAWNIRRARPSAFTSEPQEPQS